MFREGCPQTPVCKFRVCPSRFVKKEFVQKDASFEFLDVYGKLSIPSTGVFTWYELQPPTKYVRLGLVKRLIAQVNYCCIQWSWNE